MIGVLNDIGTGFINSQLYRIDFSLIKTCRSSDLLDKLTDLFQALEPAGECNLYHSLETTYRLGNIVKDFKVFFHTNQL